MLLKKFFIDTLILMNSISITHEFHQQPSICLVDYNNGKGKLTTDICDSRYNNYLYAKIFHIHLV